MTPSLHRIQAEYREMPGLRLTCEQVARLCGVERDACEQLLLALVDSRFLELTSDGRYARPSDTRSDRRTLDWSVTSSRFMNHVSA